VCGCVASRPRPSPPLPSAAALLAVSAPCRLAQHGRRWRRAPAPLGSSPSTASGGTPALLGRRPAPEPDSRLAARPPDPMPNAQEAARIGRRRGGRRQALRRADPAHARRTVGASRPRRPPARSSAGGRGRRGSAAPRALSRPQRTGR
jgi:hypothetical protein